MTPAPQLPEHHCSACHVHIDHTSDVARHNLECAATGERSYPGHHYYQAVPTLRQVISDDAEQIRERLRKNGVRVDSQSPVGVLAADVHENGWRRGANN